MIQLSQVTRPGKTALLPSPGWAQGRDRLESCLQDRVTSSLVLLRTHTGQLRCPHLSHPQVSFTKLGPISRQSVMPEVEDTAFQYNL